MKSIKNILFLFILFSFSGLVNAADEQFSARLEGSDIANGETLNLVDDKYPIMQINPTWANDFTNYKVKNKIWLGLNPSNTLITSESCEVILDVEYRLADATIQTTACTLYVEYDSDGTQLITDKSTFVFEDAHVINITIDQVTSGSIEDFILQSEINVERYYTFDGTGVQGVNSQFLTSNDYIEFHWAPKYGAEEYELEYVHINDYTLASGNYKNPAILWYNFYENSTRISTDKVSYKIPNTYDHGYIIYRVRAIGRHGANFDKRKEGVWSLQNEGTVSSVATDHKLQINNAYNDNLNWSYQATMSENGKRMQGISFVDGLGRQRQQLMHNPETEQVIVSNVYYDYHGRPVIQDLGTPVEDEELKHYAAFNRSAVDGQAFAPEHFDEEDVSGACPVLPDEFHPDFGAGEYYSTNNSTIDGENHNIPDAEGYPYSQVQYMPDQTGRIKRTGAFGETHQIGNGHETKYMYSTPSQEELNRLFGSEVGYNKQYQKRMMRDANGQVYITYYDLAGRVIASGMAGVAPQGIDAIPGNDPISDFETTLIDQTISDLSWSKPEEVLSDGVYTFNYDFTPEEYQDTCMSGSICFDCVYDLTLMITDAECDGDTIFEHVIQINGGSLDEVCSSGTYSIDTAIFLYAGSYHYARNISINEDAIDDYWCSYLNDNSCWNDYNAVYNSLYESNNFDNCQPSLIDPNTIGLPDTASSCTMKEYIMMLQLSPNGQYAEYDIDSITGELDASNYPLSIFNPSNELPDPSASWKNPTSPYLDEYGDSAFVLITDSSGFYTPELSTTSNLKTGSIPNTFLAPPQDLLNAQDFIVAFENSWAASLLDYHPEACYLSFCFANEDSESYDSGMDTIQSFQEACGAGYFNPLDITYIEADIHNQYLFYNCFSNSATDPFFESGGGGYDFADDVQDTMSNFMVIGGQYPETLDIWTYSIFVVAFDGEYGDSAHDMDRLLRLLMLYEADSCEIDQIWIYYRKLYKQLKQSYYQLAQLDYVMANDCYNGCFGVESFDPSTPIPTVPNVQYFNNYTDVNNNNYNPSASTDQPCYVTTAAYYENKTPVFIQYWDLLGSVVDTISAQNLYDSVVVATCETSCANSAENWVASLYDCDNIDSTKIANIKAELIELCQMGCSPDYMDGVSSLTSASTTNGNQSFDEILAYHLGSGYVSEVCNIYLFEDLPPQEGNPDPPLTAPENYLDDCGCNKIFEANAQYDSLLAIQALPAGVNSLEDMLYYNTQIQVDDADSWLCRCNEYFPGTWPGQWNETQINLLLDEEIIVPHGLSCNDTTSLDECIDCGTVNDAVLDMVTYFESEGVYSIDTVSNYEQILGNYLNQEFKFNLPSDDYINFINSCNGTTEDPYCYLSDEIKSWVQVMDLLAKRGQLLAEDISPVDLYDDNIVYERGDFGNYLQKPYYWTCDGGGDCDSETLTVYFGTNSADACSFVLDFSEGAVFDFDQIIGFSALSMVENTDCSSASDFRLTVSYLDCGLIKQTAVYGTTDCVDVAICSCGNTGQLLCDDEIDLDTEIDLSVCFESTLDELEIQAYDLFQDNLSEAYIYFESNYNEKCAQAFETESYTYTSGYQMYQFTLFYYDQAGNLIKTIAPEGVDFSDPADNAAINQARDDVSGYNDIATTGFFPDHEYVTEYHYNSYGQLTKTTNPDQEGDTKYWYDRYGRIVCSQNPHQAEDKIYSYTYYDAQGRPSEVGQVLQTTNVYDPSETVLKADDLGASFKHWVEDYGTKGEVTITIYDEPLSTAISNKFENGQQNLRLRVASILYFESFSAYTDTATDYTSATHYSYDPHGNVIETLQDVPMMQPVEQDIKSTQYDYDLISGNMNKVEYQKEEIDGYTHIYHYDELNRLKEVQTSTDNEVHLSTEAKYHYYDYGPLARVETGEYQVQGTDYAYTINGWLKGANSNTLDAARDMGKDGTTGYYTNNPNVHRHFAVDAFGFSLNYFEDDYSGIGTNNFEADYNGTDFGNASTNLYNGNIRHMVTAIKELEIQGYAYTYDQLQRLKKMEVFRDNNLVANNNWNTSASTTDYLTEISYDKNGNITTLARNGYTPNLNMDQFTYNYDLLGGEKSNRLDYVTDAVTTSPYSGDIKHGQSTNNYQYNKIGELVGDVSESMELRWRYGDHKLSEVIRTDADSPNLRFVYNPLGVRVAKIEKPRSGGSELSDDNWTITYYAYDANGQLMATYDSDLYDGSVKETVLEEQYIYGSKRVGVIKSNKTVYYDGMSLDPFGVSTVTHQLGKKRYELTNHLGNVMATITDRKSISTDYYFGYNFSSGTEGWSSCTQASVTQSSGELQVSTYGSSNCAYKVHSTVVGEEYHVTILADKGSAPDLELSLYGIGNYPLNNNEPTYITFTATGTSTALIIQPTSTAGSYNYSIDQVEIYQNAKYVPTVVQYADYYAGGMIMPGRSHNLSESRHLFNGMEADAEVSGDGNSYTTQFRQYDPRLGRWKSLDPLMSKYPNMSPYVAFNNNPIYFTDPLGLEGDPPKGGGDNTRGWSDQGGSEQGNRFYNPDGGGNKGNRHFTGTSEGGPGRRLVKGKDGNAYLAREGDLYTNTESGRQYTYTGSSSNSGWSEINFVQDVEEVSVMASDDMSLDERMEFAGDRNLSPLAFNLRMALINADNINPGVEEGKIHVTGQRYSDGRYDDMCLSCHSPSGVYYDDMARLGWDEFALQIYVNTTIGLLTRAPVGGLIGNAARGSSKLFGKEVVTTTTRMGRDGKAVEVIFKDGSKIDINAARVKQWTPNTHPNAPAGTLQKVKFDNSLPGSKGYKRTPTQSELDFLNGL